MKVLLTGATGFLGSHLSRQLESSGHEVYSLCRSPEKFHHFSIGGKLIHGDLSHDREHQWIEELPEDLEAVVHAAGLVHSFSPQKFFQINFRATENLIHDLKNKFPSLKFLLVSSLAACGPARSGTPLTEEAETNPVSDYGRSKLSAESVLLQEAPGRWQKTIFRPPMIIGPGDRAIVDVFKMVKSKLILAPGRKGDEGQYSFICVYDLVNLIQAALEKDQTTERQIYFMAHPQIVTYGEIVEQIKKLMGIDSSFTLRVPLPLIRSLAKGMALIKRINPKADFRLTPDKTYELGEPAWICSGEKSRRKFGLEYQWDLEKTLKVTYEDYCERGWI